MNLPVFKTTHPNKVFDYMAAGKPVLLAIDGVIKEVVESARAGIIIPPGDSQSLAKAVLTLKEDREGAREMGCAGQRYVEEHFNREKQAAGFLKLVCSL